MGKYEPLGAYLRARNGPEVPMTFEEIERVIGVPLPPKAQGHRAWWSNNPDNNVMTRVWLEAGFETKSVDLVAKRLVFRRTDKTGAASRPPPTGRSPLFGAMKGLIHIAPGVDLTEPSDPDWGSKD